MPDTFYAEPQPYRIRTDPAVGVPASLSDERFRGYKAKHLKGSAPDDLAFRVATANDSDYGHLLRSAFAFLRAQGEGRYSASALMRVLRAADRYDESGASPLADLPEVGVARRPYSYDEDTEVKSGGLVGVQVVFPADNYRSLLAVHRNSRRQGIGTVLTRAFQGHRGYPLTMWVGPLNTTGQQYLLSVDLYPTTINTLGAIRYGTGDESMEVS